MSTCKRKQNKAAISQVKHRKSKLQATDKLGIFLFWLKNNCNLDNAATVFQVSQSTAHEEIHFVLNILYDNLEEYDFPSEEELQVFHYFQYSYINLGNSETISYF